MQREKLLRDIRSIRERPQYQEMIVRQGFLPDIVFARDRLYWDGISVRCPTGGRMFCRANVTPLHLELKRMASAGFWGDLRNVILNWNRYAQIRDAIDGRIRGVFSDIGLWTPPIDRIARRRKCGSETFVGSSL